MPSSSLLDPLRDVLARERLVTALGAVAVELIAMAVVLPASPAFCVAIDMAPPGGAVWVLWAFGVLGALGVAFLVRRVLELRAIDRTPIMIKLLHDPEDVVWVHSGIAIEQRMYGETVNRSRHVAFLTESRDNDSVAMSETDARRVLSAIEDYLPHALVSGFSKEVLQRYEADPASLRRTPRDGPRKGGSYRDAAGVAEPAARALPKPVAAPYWLAAVICVALVVVAPTLASLVLAP